MADSYGATSPLQSSSQKILDETSKQIRMTQELITNGPVTLRAMCVLGGVGMIASGAINLVVMHAMLSPLHILIEFYLCLFGVVVFVLEAKDILCAASLRAWIAENVKILTFIWGRGLFYIFAGSLALAQFPLLLDTVTGGYMIGMGILSMLVAQATEATLRKLRDSLKEEKVVNDLYDQFNESGEGLTASQFHRLARELGTDLTLNEMDAAMVDLDPESAGRVSFDTFNSWWLNK